MLASERLTFSPALPSQYQDAISSLPMGVVEKIALQFNQDIFNVGTINTLATPLVDKVGNSFVQAQLFGKNIGICFVGGDLARSLTLRAAPRSSTSRSPRWSRCSEARSAVPS